jgi:glycosyltransferase involved in cell wall biosynthesis
MAADDTASLSDGRVSKAPPDPGPAPLRAFRRTRSPTLGAERLLRIAILAPPWIPVPSPGYGGIEVVVSLLTEELVARGHHVTLFAAPGSRSSARVRSLLPAAHPREIERSVYEVDHVAEAFAEIDRAAAAGEPFDVVHDHCGFVALAMADRLATPLLHTIHGPFTDDTYGFYRRHGGKAKLTVLSRSQRTSGPPEVGSAHVIPNPIDVSVWPASSSKDEYLLWMGRMTSEKGAHRAVEVAKRAGRKLVLAGPVQPGQEEYFRSMVEPKLEDPRIRYVGEVGGRTKLELFTGAAALLMPIRWPEPFGMVMVEAMAAGTPVLAFPEGAAPEIVIHGESGFLVDDEDEMTAAIRLLDEIDPARCRALATERFDVRAVAGMYEAIYRDSRLGVGDSQPAARHPIRQPA